MEQEAQESRTESSNGITTIPEFRAWPKIPRWENENYVITEKIDGSNGCIVVTDWGEVFAQSRNAFLTDTKSGDNFGFCKWVKGNQDDLLSLGVGYHYGEWWGEGIQRNYGLNDRRFSLFNVWHPDIPECVSKVPVIGNTLEGAIGRLTVMGSIAAPGFMKPEGLILSSTKHNRVRYKYIIHGEKKRGNSSPI